MRKSVTRITTLAAVTAVAALSLQGVAQAKFPVELLPDHANHDVTQTTGPFASTLTHKFVATKGKFKGKLTSAFSDPTGILEDAADAPLVCVTDRKVTLYKKVKTGTDKVMGSDKTDDLGVWSVPAAVTRGKYYASVGKSELLIREYYNGIDFYAVCKSATSPVSGL